MQLCDKCGLEYFCSTHDLMAELILLKVALKNLKEDIENPKTRGESMKSMDSIIGWIDLKIVANKGGK